MSEQTLFSQVQTVPTRQVIEEAITTNDRLGHDNLGSLSYSHGFLPRREPARALTSRDHAAWDQVANAIPEMFRNFATRQRIDQMPVLSAAEDALPDEDLLRASSIFSILAHVYWYADPRPPEDGIPACIQHPWEEITRRLHRPAPHLSFIDLNTHNWHFIDPDAEQPFMVENLRLAVPMIGNEDERRFQMTPIEMLYLFSPMLEAVIRAQEAVVCDDPNLLKEQLILISDGLKHLTYVSLMKVNPNPYSGEVYINPVVWGKTAALFASPFQKEYVPGPSGTAIPSFTTLDLFFGRKSYKTSVGHETHETRRWFPRFWQEWLDAVEQISIPEYVAQCSDATLSGVYNEARDAYAGESGILNRHRIKAYGYLDASFKAGRVKTLGGFAGSFSERVWDRMAVVLDETRMERYGAYPQVSHTVPVKRVEMLHQPGGLPVSRIVLDIEGTGLRYRAGDRCAILPENADDLTDRTLDILRATGDEPIILDASWRQHVKLRHGYQDVQVLPLRTLLRFGRIRPVERPAALHLYALTQNERLQKIIAAWAEDQWELWDLLEMLAETGFNPRRLWKAIPGDREHICRIVQPERWRLYSISSVMDDPPAESASEIHLTVGQLEYQTPKTAVSEPQTRRGTASSFLARLCSDTRVSIQVVHPPRFSLPADASRPIVMFAGGTGIAPMRSLILERARTPGAGPMTLFFATRTQAELYHQPEWEPLIAAGLLELRVGFSREDVRAVFNPASGTLRFEPGQRQRIDQMMLEEPTASMLWEMLRSPAEGGQGAYFYLCGRTSLANTVLESIKQIIARFSGSSNPNQVLYHLIGQDRFMLEIFTTYGGAQFDEGKVQFSISELAQHNDDQHGYWMAISGRIYDVTEFGHLHPGGLKIIQSYSGMDATFAYQVIQHHVMPEVDAMLGMYEIGVLRQPDLGKKWGVGISGKGLRFISLQDAYRAWCDLLFMIVEMQNGIANDFRVKEEPFTDLEHDGQVLLTPIKVQRFGLTHARLVEDYLPIVLGDPLDALWNLTIGILGETHLPAQWMRERVQAVQTSREAHTAHQLSRLLDQSLGSHALDPMPLNEFGRAYGPLCDLLEQHDHEVLAALKEALRSGVQMFERYRQDIPTSGREPLLQILMQIPGIVARFYEGLQACIDLLKEPE